MATFHASTLARQLQALLTGLETVDLKRSALEFGGAPLSQEQAVATASSFFDLHRSVEEAYAGYQKALAARNAAHGDAKAFIAGAKRFLDVVLGPENPDLALFGFKPKRPSRPLTSEERLARAAKLRATRVLRRTLGKRQEAELRVTADPRIEVTFPSTIFPVPIAGTLDKQNGQALPR